MVAVEAEVEQEVFRPRWHSEAACYQTGVENFFPSDKNDPSPHNTHGPTMYKRLETICSGCPVLLECFASSMEFADEFGIWAGIDRLPRLRMLRDLKAGNITMEELTAALAFRGPRGLRDAYS